MIIALVDCNNFYASCERVFQPNLRNRPVVVLSNNDGCVIARSNEAKEFGIPMGAPFFKFREQMERDGIVVRSSNYALYGDMSNRVMTTLSNFAPEIEVYSIDECFLNFTGMQHMDLTEYCRHIREEVYRWTGIPVSIGIGQTKTLAKIANRLAKKSVKADGVLDLSDNDRWIEHALHRTEVGDVWGIGRCWSKMLNGRGILTALDFRDAADGWVRQRMGVVGSRTQYELRGTPCVDLEIETPDKQTVCVSRSFGKSLDTYDSLHDALVTFGTRGAEKIRKLGLVAAAVNIFIRTNPHREDEEQYSNSITISFPSATNDTRVILGAVIAGLKRIFKSKLRYKKAGILLLDLVRGEDASMTLFSQPDVKSERLMKAFDDINDRLGSGLVSFGQVRKTKTWYMTQDHVSQHYTTRWDELPLVD
jgi:DNA polymerase V